MTIDSTFLSQELVLRHAGDRIRHILPKGIGPTLDWFCMEYDTISLSRHMTVTLHFESDGYRTFHVRSFKLPDIYEDINIIEFVARKVKEFYFVTKG